MKHSIYGASISPIYLACNASVLMSRGKPNHTNEPAEQGTAAHACGEFCLRMRVNAYECIGMVFNRSKAFPDGFTVDQEMADAVQVYVAHILSICLRLGVNPLVEIRVVMSSIRDDVFGTSDCIIIAGDTLYVLDYKHGWIIVNIANNSQAIFYAIAVMDTYNLWGQIKHIHTAIIQPRPDHIDGAIRYHEYTPEQLHSWFHKFRKAILYPSDKPVAGTHCKYCLARANCKTRMMRTIELAFSDVPLDQVSIEELEILYLETQSIKTHLQAVDDRMTELAKEGHQFENLKLVTARKFAICKDETAFMQAVVKSGVDKSKLYNTKLVSMTAAKKVVDKNIVNEYFIKPPAGIDLVPLTDSRPAMSTNRSAAGVFESVN